MANGILEGLRTSLQKLLNLSLKKNVQNKVLDVRNRVLDISTFDNNERRKYSNSFSLERFRFDTLFDLEKDRIQRYAELENIYKMLPETQRAISLICDDVLGPSLNKKTNNLNIDPKYGEIGDRGKEYANIVLAQTEFLEKILANVIFSMGLYGDAFLENKIFEGNLRFVLLDCKRCTLIYDKDLDLELGLAYQLEDVDKSNPIKEYLGQIYPTIRINLNRNRNAVITSAARRTDNKHASDYNSEIIVNHEEIEKILFDITSELGGQYRYIPPGKYTHYKLNHNNLYFPYGTSLLEGCRSVAKQLLLAEQAMTIARITRAPSRKMFTVECSGIPSDEIPSFMSNIQANISKERVLDTNNMDLISNAATYLEDYWSPSIENTPQLTIDTIEGDPIDDKIADVEYLKDKLSNSLGVPKAYLGEDADTSTRALLTLEDIVYSRKILKVIADVNTGINDTINNCFALIKVKELQESVDISLIKPQNIEDNVKLENLSSRLDLANNLIGFLPMISKKWIVHNILEYNEEDLEDMEREKEEEHNFQIFNEGKEEMDEFGGEDSGGGFDMGGGFGGPSDDDFDMEDSDIEESDTEMSDISTDTSAIETEPAAPEA